MTSMKLRFKNQDFQTDAVNAVVDLFAGQDTRQSTFSVEHGGQMTLLQNDFGIGNALRIGWLQQAVYPPVVRFPGGEL